MKRHALQVVLLAFFVVNVAPSAASEGNGTETGADFTVTISREGVKEDSQQVFSLGPSASLRVVDESNKAIFLPQPTTAEQDTAAQYSLAYVFEKGKCNFEKTFAFSDAFPGYSRPLWVRSSSQGSRVEASPLESAAYYTLTNPPAKFLSEGVSFCVRFTSPPAIKTTTTTQSPTTIAAETTVVPPASTGSSSAPSTGSGDSSTQADAGTGTPSVPSEDPQTGGAVRQPIPPNPSSPSDIPPSSLPGDSEGTDNNGDRGETGEESDNGHKNDAAVSQDEARPSENQIESQQADSATPGNQPGTSEHVASKAQDEENQTATHSSTSADSKDPSTEESQQHSQLSQATTSQNTPVDTSDQKSTDGDAPARLRRLSDDQTSAVKYLTIVVHSAVGGFAGRMLSLSAAMLSLATVLLSFV
ncbi:toxoplasma gondii family A protein [Toxoplasma gondii GAB2-2007-GAL-DOM2]|uniref:Toxoplasma gondii family A protein n=2 Tax=Toxoplasma gondii TaxID=5811 RepID=S7W783_TOXGG|nr:toxoplasma gondii family A protein [Toxoplasma gondii GT1]KFG32947.1 toxoplasma gondii family A protein [Toxoplasma gondii GAB2-2007-GAL-DOM2]